MKTKRFEESAKKLPVGHVAKADEIAEAYLYLMKCVLSDFQVWLVMLESF